MTDAQTETQRDEVLKAQHYLNDGVFVGLPDQEIARRARLLVEATRPSEQAVTEADLLAGTAKHLNWELDWGSLDLSDESSECAWRVHARNGNRNDREWTLIGYGETPAAALKAAMEAAASTKQEDK